MVGVGGIVVGYACRAAGKEEGERYGIPSYESIVLSEIMILNNTTE